jgi:D-serine dehydratase
MIRTETNTNTNITNTNTNISNTNISNTNTQTNIIHSKIVVNNELEQMKSEIENKVNPKTLNESMYLLSNPELLLDRMKEGSDLFDNHAKILLSNGLEIICDESVEMIEKEFKEFFKQY